MLAGPGEPHRNRAQCSCCTGVLHRCWFCLFWGWQGRNRRPWRPGGGSGTGGLGRGGLPASAAQLQECRPPLAGSCVPAGCPSSRRPPLLALLSLARRRQGGSMKGALETGLKGKVSATQLSPPGRGPFNSSARWTRRVLQPLPGFPGSAPPSLGGLGVPAWVQPAQRSPSSAPHPGDLGRCP